MKSLLRCVSVFAVFAGAAVPAWADLSAVEKRIVEAVKARSPAALALLEKSVVINSGTLNTEGVKAVGRTFRAEFDELGFVTRWIDMPEAMSRAGHLAAAREGNRGKKAIHLCKRI